MKWRPYYAVPAFLLAAILGCQGEGRVEVSGKVSVDGTPVERGSIAFFPVDGTQSPTAGDDIIEGHYSIPAVRGPKPGVFKVELRAEKKTGKRIAVPSPAPPGMMDDEVVNLFPPAFNSKSTLKVELKPGSNSQDFDVKTK